MNREISNQKSTAEDTREKIKFKATKTGYVEEQTAHQIKPIEESRADFIMCDIIVTFNVRGAEVIRVAVARVGT